MPARNEGVKKLHFWPNACGFYGAHFSDVIVLDVLVLGV
jgi:hypothetical protein